MDNVVTIIKSKTNELVFDVSVKGLDVNDEKIEVRFVIKTSDVDLTFHSKHTDGDKWEVQIPPIESIESTTYPFAIEVVADGYMFTPMTGIINVVKSPEIYSTAPKHKISPPDNRTSPSTRTTTRSSNRDVIVDTNLLADAILNGSSTSDVAPFVESAPVSTPSRQDAKVQDILKGITKDKKSTRSNNIRNRLKLKT